MAEVQLFAVQSRIDAETYASAQSFADAMRHSATGIEERRHRGENGEARCPALAVWPEMVATFLLLAGRLDAVRDCRTYDEAMKKAAVRMLPQIAVTALRRRPRSLTEAFMATLAPKVWRMWWETFSSIARDFDIWVVAGSALVPVNENGADTPEMRARDARFYNTSLTFAPTGHAVSVTRKLNVVPTQEDVLDMSAGSPSDLSAVDTPFGRLGTVICYDGFNEAHTSDEPCFVPGAPILDGLGVEIIAQPSANSWPWDAPWVFNEPGENLLRSQQWFDEGLFTALRELSHVRYAVNPQLVGEVFDVGFEAPSLILERRPDGEVVVLAQAADPRKEDLLDVTVELP